MKDVLNEIGFSNSTNQNRLNDTDVVRMPYVQFMATLEEINRPPGGLGSILSASNFCNVNASNKVLDVGCNTGYVSFELSRYRKCQVIGIDLDSDMVSAARRKAIKFNLQHLTDFKVADASQTSFNENYFDLTICGGSMAFVQKRKETIREIIRITKTYGFIVDIEFFYKTIPPKEHFDKLATVLGFEIPIWKLKYWQDIYDMSDLDAVSMTTSNALVASDSSIDLYAQRMVQRVSHKFTLAGKNAALERLTSLMHLFNCNQSYLNYGIFILRKKGLDQEPFLFC